MQGINMQKMLSPMATIYQAQLEASRQFADAIFSGTAKIDNVLLEASHRACIEQLRFAQSLVAVRDTQGASNAQAKYLTQRQERAMDCQRELIRVFTEVQSDLGKATRNFMQQLGSGAIPDFSAALEPKRELEPAAYNPLTGMFTAWQSVFREATSVANRNIEAARTTLEDVANTAFSQAGEAIDETVGALAAGGEKKASAASDKRK